ncbi:MAG: hypothetical protein KDB61_12725, partial [Planctomycetes bacterium]|nr:hypothetical protein [Planctomycetota bacterium]
MEHDHMPSAEELAFAQAAMDAVDGPLLYGRVDMMRDGHGQWRLMELELIEPFLYPNQGPNMGRAFAAALERVLRREA